MERSKTLVLAALSIAMMAMGSGIASAACSTAALAGTWDTVYSSTTASDQKNYWCSLTIDNTGLVVGSNCQSGAPALPNPLKFSANGTCAVRSNVATLYGATNFIPATVSVAPRMLSLEWSFHGKFNGFRR